jgi:hypothetical protein
MNHTTLAIAAILATTLVLSTVATSVLPQQQAFAHSYRHHHHHHNNKNHNNSNDVRVIQTINQLNNCTAAACENQADNDVQIHS